MNFNDSYRQTAFLDLIGFVWAPFSEDNPSQEEKENRQHHALHHGNHQVDGPVESWRTPQGIHPWMERSLGYTIIEHNR